MKAGKLLLALSIMLLLTTMMGGCLFGGDAKEPPVPDSFGDELVDPGAPGAPDGQTIPGEPGMPAEPAPAGIPSEPGGPDDFGEPGEMAPPSGPPGEISLDEPGAEPAEAVSVPGGSSAKALQLKHQGKYDAAAAEYRAVLKADPDDAEANWGLAWILAEQGVNTPKQRDARAYFARFLTVSDNVGRSAMAEAALKRIK